MEDRNRFKDIPLSIRCGKCNTPIYRGTTPYKIVNGKYYHSWCIRKEGNMKTKTEQESVDDVDKVTVTMTKKEWRSVLESFETLPYPEDWNDSGVLADEQEEAIRQKLTTAAGGR